MGSPSLTFRPRRHTNNHSVCLFVHSGEKGSPGEIITSPGDPGQKGEKGLPGNPGPEGETGPSTVALCVILIFDVFLTKSVFTS